MVAIKHAFAAAAVAAQAVAVDIIVKSSGGNETGKFGHSFGYGFLHEVRLQLWPKATTMLIEIRTSTTPEMAVSTLS